MGSVPTLTLNNGVAMPALGLGVFLSKPEETADAVRTALDAGYRLIDTAAAYLNERAVGEGLRASGVDRDDVFVTTKLWVSQYGYDEALKGFDASLDRLGLDHLDLYLLHWPVPASFDRTIEAYRAAERLLSEGRVRAIGVCNFLPEHVERLTAETDVVPAVNQIELHPYFTQWESRVADATAGIVTQSWSPIGGVFGRTSAAGRDEAKSPLEHPVISALAAKYARTPAQIIIRWHLDHGLSVIPKSVKPERIRENGDVFGFSLTQEEIAQIDALDTGRRAGSDPKTFGIDSYKVDIDAQ